VWEIKNVLLTKMNVFGSIVNAKVPNVNSASIG